MQLQLFYWLSKAQNDNLTNFFGRGNKVGISDSLRKQQITRLYTGYSFFLTTNPRRYLEVAGHVGGPPIILSTTKSGGWFIKEIEREKII